MKVDLCPTASLVKDYELQGKTTIVIDVLRATSCIITALANGCEKVIPVYTPEDAFKYQEQDKTKFILGGERESVKISGFDLGNSPLEYQKLSYSGKTVIITTTNGTRAIKEAETSENLLIGSMLNAKAVATKALEFGKPLTIICSGTRDQFSLDDFVTAGLIIKELSSLGKEIKLTDFAKTALLAFKAFEWSLFEGLKSSDHGRDLVKMGLERDLAFCSQKNKYTVVGKYENNEISVIS